jgi:hypothetical protein
MVSTQTHMQSLPLTVGAHNALLLLLLLPLALWLLLPWSLPLSIA